MPVIILIMDLLHLAIFMKHGCKAILILSYLTSLTISNLRVR